jgi:hypothetical protein
VLCLVFAAICSFAGIGDDLMGITTIDIEDRWFSKEWRKLGQFRVFDTCQLPLRSCSVRR